MFYCLKIYKDMQNLEDFRKEVKEWLDKNCPSSMRSGADRLFRLTRFGEEEMQFIKILNLKFGWIGWVLRMDNAYSAKRIWWRWTKC